MTTCTLEQIEQYARDIEFTWTEFVDEPVIDAATVAVARLRDLATALRRLRGLPLTTDGHLQFTTEENGTWCHESCPRPEDECGELAVQQANDRPTEDIWEQGAQQAQRADWEREQRDAP